LSANDCFPANIMHTHVAISVIISQLQQSLIRAYSVCNSAYNHSTQKYIT